MPMHKLQENRSLIGFESKAGADGVGEGASGVTNKYIQDTSTNNQIRAGLLANRAQQEKYNNDNGEAVSSYNTIIQDKGAKSPEGIKAQEALDAIKQGQAFYQNNENSLRGGIKGGTLTSDGEGKPIMIFGDGVRNTINQAGLEAIKKARGGTAEGLTDELNGRYFGFESGINENYTPENVGDPNFIKQYTGSGHTWMQAPGKPIMTTTYPVPPNSPTFNPPYQGPPVSPYRRPNTVPTTPMGTAMATYGKTMNGPSLLQPQPPVGGVVNNPNRVTPHINMIPTNYAGLIGTHSPQPTVPYGSNPNATRAVAQPTPLTLQQQMSTYGNQMLNQPSLLGVTP